jgi:hypothetical protein
VDDDIAWKYVMEFGIFDNQEDSLVVNEAAIDRGLFRADSLKEYHAEIVKNPSTSQDDIFTKPDANKVTGMKQGNYSKLNDLGFAPEETEISNNDIIIGKVSPIQPTGNNNKVYKDNSVQYKSNVKGVIDRVHTGIYNAEGYEMYNIRVRMERIPIVGDKFCIFSKNCDVLTSEGWIKITDINLDHKIAILDPEIDNILYEKPSEVHCFDYDSELDGKMYQLKSQLVDLTVTPNHRMYVKKRRVLENKKYDYPEEFSPMFAKDCFGKRLKYKKNGIWNKPEQEIFKYNNIELDMNSWLYFIGIWFAEGWVDKHNKRITISANKKRVQDKLDEICNKMNLHIIKSKDKWHIHKIDIYNYLLPFSIGAINKYLPEWVFELSNNQSQILLEGLLLGDGYINKTNTCKYYTSSEKLANNITQLALHCGWSANMYKRKITENTYNGKLIKTNAQPYAITIIKNKLEPEINHSHTKKQNGTRLFSNSEGIRKEGLLRPKGGQSEEWIDYKGTVHCVTVRTGIFMVRQNGKPVWTCNSNRHG